MPTDAGVTPKYEFTGGLLSQLKLPTGATVDYTYATWWFWHGNFAGLNNICIAKPPEADACIQRSGTASCLQFAVAIPFCTEQDPIIQQFLDSQVGVVSRTETIPRDPGVSGTPTTSAQTLYKQYAFPFGETASTPGTTVGPQTLTVVVHPPTDAAFNAAGDPTSKRRSKAVLFRSAPVLVAGESLAGDRVGADLEERYFENDVTDDVFTMPPCGGGVERKYCSSKAVRVVRRSFEYDSITAETGNRRLKQETVCYGSATAAGVCNTGKSHTVVFSNSSNCGVPPTSACGWDADNGRHYNVETHSGTLGDASDGRTITTKWAPANWKPTFSAANRAFPNLFKSRVETDAASGTAVERFYEFSTTTGFLKGVVNHDTVTSRALVNCRYDEAGNGTVDREFTDVATTAITPPETYCSRTNATFPVSFAPGSSLFGKKYTYSNGQLLTAGWLKTATSTPFLINDYTRDGTTGWITRSGDTASQGTDYTYDSIGRVTSVTPPGEIAINICYKDLDNQGSTKYPTQTTVYRTAGAAACPTHYSAALYSWEHYDYDGLGRRIRTRKMMPATSGVQVAKQFGLRDGRGNQFFSSEWVPDATAEDGIVPTAVGTSGDATNCSFSDGAFGSKRPKTALGTYSMCWDPFGRPQQIVGSKTSTLGEIKREDGTSKYSNTVELFKTYCINGTLASSSVCTATTLGAKYDSVSTTNRKDAFGRLVKVEEPTTDVTEYDYDVNGKLTLVTQAPDQTRTFTYDRLGFLRSETTPEKGSVSYDSIGSLGNVIQKTEGGVAHAYAYDYAGRLSTETAGGIRYLMNCYDGSVVTPACPDATPNFPGGSKPKGKLSRRVGRNAKYRPLWPTTPLVAMDVTEDLEYSGLGGRISGRSTVLQGGANSASKETWTYTSRGLLDVHGHPRLNVPNASIDDSAFFKETYSYVAGLPTSIAVTGKKADASSVTGATIAAAYALSGGVAKVTATQTGGSAFVTTIAADTTTYLPRPVRISTSAGGFDTGNYSFDGAGNILAMNKDTDNVDLFAYDNLSRVTFSKVKALSVSNDQNYEYADRYGNLTKIITNGTERPLGTSTTTNRINAWDYDAMGNLTGNGTSEIYAYDALSRQVESVKSGVDWQYLFSGGDERFVRVPAAANPAVTRREMARFLVQAKGWAPATSCTESSRTFTDVHCSDQDWGLIETFVANGITAGCGGTSYCPDTAVTRAQMAVFLLKAEHGSTYDPPNCTAGLFVDVTCTPNVGFPDWIEQLYDEQVTAGCQTQPLAYCPNASTTEFQMAAFLSKPNMWPSYHAIPGGSWYTFRNDQDQLVTEFTDSFAGRDNVFLGSLLIASYVSNVNSGVVGWNFHAADHLGTLRLTVNGANLQTIESRKYYPVGEQVGMAGPLNQKVGFAVMERDSESNRFYDHARNHDFNLGRFVSPDKVVGRPKQPQTWNRYTYAGNNPLRFVDPTGRELRTYQLARMQGIAGSDASKVSLAAGRVVLSGVSAGDLKRNEGLRLLDQLVSSKNVYYYGEGKTIDTLGKPQNVKGMANLDNLPDSRLPGGKTPDQCPAPGLDSAIVIDQSRLRTDPATETQSPSKEALAFHELAESYARVDQGMPYQDAHEDAVAREEELMKQNPGFTLFPAGKLLRTYVDN